MLQMPKKRPKYRADRDHNSFISKISDFGVQIPSFHDGIKQRCTELYDVQEIEERDILEWQRRVLDRLDNGSDSKTPWKYRTRFESQY